MMALDAQGRGYTPSGPSEDFIGTVGGSTRVQTGFFNRPANVIPYDVGDLIGPSLSANDVANAIAIPNAVRKPGGTGRIIRVRGATNQAAFAGTIRAHLFKTRVAPAVGDNGVLAAAVANYVNYYGPVDITLQQSILSDGSKGFMAYSPPIAFDVPDGATDIYAILEARTAFTPASGQRFSLTYEFDVD